MQAEVLILAGRPEEALKMVEQAIRLNPRYHPHYTYYLDWAYRCAGRCAEAITAMKTLLLQNPNFLTVYLDLALCYLQQWAFQLSPDPKALEATQRAMALSDTLPRFPLMMNEKRGVG